MMINHTRGTLREQTVEKEVYFSEHYFSLPQLCSFAHQLHEIYKLKPTSVLEIGIGNGFTSTYLRRAGIEVCTVDINPILEPDIVAAIDELPDHPALKDRHFDLVVCCEVLEHLPFDQFEKSIAILRMFSHRLFLTLPTNEIWFGFSGFLRHTTRRIRPIAIGRMRKILKKPEWSAHFWELNYDSYCTRAEIIRLLQNHFGYVHHGVFQLNRLHEFFICETSKWDSIHPNLDHSKPKLFIVSVSNLKTDPRVYRQIMALKDQYQITTCGLASSEIEGVGFIPLELNPRTRVEKVVDGVQLLSRQYAAHYWNRPMIRQVLARLKDSEPHLAILANDAEALPLAVHLAERWSARLIYDAHEYSPRQFENNRRWRLFFQRYYDWICRAHLPKVDAMMTVSQGLAQAYAQEFGVEPAVVTSAPNFVEQNPTPVDPQRIRMIHHGAAMPEHNLEVMIEMMEHVDERFHLDFMLVPSNRSYLRKLQKMAKHLPTVRFVPPVPMLKIAQTCNAYDIGLFLLPPVNFNYANALPNKFFEFVQGRLAIAIGPSQDMQRLVEQYDLGVVSEDFSPRSLARKLNQLDAAQIARFKENAHKAAPELCAEKNMEHLIELVKNA